jgi:hypothetical protein
MEQTSSFYGMLAFLTVTLVGGYIAAIIFLNFKPSKSTEVMIARRALRSLGVDNQPSWKTVIISASRDVEVPLEKLWETWIKIEDWPSWSALHSSARWAGEPSWQVGARFEQALKLGFPFGRVKSIETVAQCSPEREVGWCKNNGIMKSCHIWSFTLLPNRRVRVTSTEVFHGTLVGVLKPLVILQWQRLFEKSVNGLIQHAAKIV